MPIKRDNKLPPYVYLRKSGYVMRVYIGKNQPMKAIKLCSASAPISEVWKQYELNKSNNLQTLSWLLREYESSDSFKGNAKSTRDMQSGQITRVCAYKLRNGNTFGSAKLKLITSGKIRKYLDARKRDGSPSAGNRERSLISVAWNWALERDVIIGINNPCSVVKKNEEKPRTRYASPDEYAKAYQLAERYPYLQPMMELAYLCRMRRGEILNATRAQILEKGFDTMRTKGSNDAITRWSPRLLKAVNCDSPVLSGSVKSIYIVHDRRGQQITVEAFKSAWTRLKRLMVKAGMEPFNFHDIKAAGVSDVEGNDYDKLQASGHKDLKTMRIYDRKKRLVDPTE